LKDKELLKGRSWNLGNSPKNHFMGASLHDKDDDPKFLFNCMKFGIFRRKLGSFVINQFGTSYPYVICDCYWLFFQLLFAFGCACNYLATNVFFF
jgi:hypothetical protein